MKTCAENLCTCSFRTALLRCIQRLLTHDWRLFVANHSFKFLNSFTCTNKIFSGPWSKVVAGDNRGHVDSLIGEVVQKLGPARSTWPINQQKVDVGASQDPWAWLPLLERDLTWLSNITLMRKVEQTMHHENCCWLNWYMPRWVVISAPGHHFDTPCSMNHLSKFIASL
jgi:hypothetical protein